MFVDKLGHVFDRPFENIVKKIPFSPNTLTITGFIITVIASYVLLTDLFWGGILVLAGGVFDVLDGVAARVNNRTSKFGAFLDSVLDRYSDALILLAIAFNLHAKDNLIGVYLCLVTLLASFLISYTRARAEALGEECRHGLMERPERIVAIAFGTITGFIIPVLWILLVSTHYTVFQRMYHVWKITSRK